MEIDTDTDINIDIDGDAFPFFLPGILSLEQNEIISEAVQVLLMMQYFYQRAHISPWFS